MVNPNFPHDLDIKPSVDLLGLHSQPGDQDLFGHSAQRAAISRYGIAGRVWEAAYALLLYVDPPSTWEFEPPFLKNQDSSRHTIIELGSGTGIIARSLSRSLTSGEDIIVSTDLPEVCPLLEDNLRGELNGIVFVRPLAWGNIQHVSDIASEFITNRNLSHIICSDLVYFPELLAPLLRTLIHLTSPSAVSSSPVLIISYKIRSLEKEAPFWSAFGLYFSFQPVLSRRILPDSEQDQSWQRLGSSFEDTTFIFVAQRRHDSLAWQIPTNDRDLLAGVGALGTNTPKGDEYFESLLLMTMDDS
ncbi:putative methyltransferase-domain-containing protein [Desarmillaria tabescens]|uniref:Methyltransferase-domain-containing protein n=1 Tax=Armillaria tabescens TaxID=1929756 RepID=A0AA39NPU0_ARMTA|nr:putative methyltransferase-domain-containing protein [Desarmillaria tabescens]KAK0469606.1 putative methyltransferase-domain-containing protein [Desarmillaria tabescens]